jgi:hypothetical protein
LENSLLEQTLKKETLKRNKKAQGKTKKIEYLAQHNET